MATATRIKVWDPLVRSFHWTLVAAFSVAYLAEDEALSLHVIAGYLILALLMLRLVWGVVGGRHARFTDFVVSPRRVRAYLREVIRGRARRYLGHNPAGGAMVVALLTLLLLTTLSGLLVYGVGEAGGPLAPYLVSWPDWTAEVAEAVHEFLANATLLLVGMHIVGVVVTSVQHRENLVAAMWSGYKRNGGDE